MRRAEGQSPLSPFRKGGGNRNPPSGKRGQGGFGPVQIAAAALALVLVPAPARAAVEGSPHDLIAQGYDVPKGGGSQERCIMCHASQRSAAQALIADVPPSLQARYGNASLVCFSCHDGITIVAPELDASLTAFHPEAHGHDLAAYPSLEAQETGLPHVSGVHMECTTCHDPHDNSRRPFLRAPLDEICVLCHSPLMAVTVEGIVNASGNHPAGRNPVETARAGMPIQVAADFSVAFPAAYPTLDGKTSVGTHWDLGGHLRQGASGDLGCATCHAVHGDEKVPPVPELLAKDPVRDIADEFCEGCHRGARGDSGSSASAPNPGGTLLGRTYHPCDDDVANGVGHILETRVPEGWPFGSGKPERLICSTCHRAHRAQIGTQLLRPPIKAGTFCEECHAGMPLEYHHPAGEVVGACARLLANNAGIGTVLTCDRCHRAHNAGLASGNESDFLPLLRAGLSTQQLCTVCHPGENPTCGTNSDRQASHFMGDPRSTETYQNNTPPLKTDLWPESGVPSRYGTGDRGGTMICLSCHSFRTGAVVSGDDGAARFLLARSGNPVEWSEGKEATYLCLGCHGVNPSTGGQGGHTHPLMAADAAKLGREIDRPASLTPSGKVNCDSCHRPHEAITKSGYYILEIVDGPNTDPQAVHPEIDYTITCHRCHDSAKY